MAAFHEDSHVEVALEPGFADVGMKKDGVVQYKVRIKAGEAVRFHRMAGHYDGDVLAIQVDGEARVFMRTLPNALGDEHMAAFLDGAQSAEE